MSTLIINIKELLQVRQKSITKIAGKEMSTLPIIENAYLYIEKETIVDYGSMETLTISADNTIDAKGKIVLPTWCDSHTHIVYAGDRSQEFVDRINGMTYEEIANRGGGILNSAKKLADTSIDDLYEQSAKRVNAVMRLGTGALEIKSGYGLTTASELKMLQVIKKIKANFNIPIKATFLGAHAFPKTYKENPEAYICLLYTSPSPRD